MTRRLADLDWPVATDRLAMRPATHDDAAATFAYRSQPEVAQWMTSLPTDLAAYTERFMVRTEHTLVVARHGAVIGDLMLEAHNVADSLHRDGRWLDGMQYALLADEW